MLIALNDFRRRHRQRLAAVFVVIVLCWLLVAAHSALAEPHMGDMAVCLAVAQTAALVLAVSMASVSAATALLPRPPWSQRDVWPRTSFIRAAPGPRSRAGPAFLQVFRR